MNHSKSLYMIGVPLLLLCVIISVGPGVARHTQPGSLDFDYDSSWAGRPFTPAENSIVSRAIDSIRTPPPDSITYTDADGNSKTVSCSTLAGLLQGQLDAGTMEAETLNGGVDGGEYGGEINIHEKILKEAIDSNNTDYLEELLIHEGTHKGQAESMSSEDKEIGALEAEIAYKDSIGLDSTDAEYRFAKELLAEYQRIHEYNDLRRRLARSWIGRYILRIIDRAATGLNDELRTYWLGGSEEYAFDLGTLNVSDHLVFEDYFGTDHHMVLLCGTTDGGIGNLTAVKMFQGQVEPPYPYWQMDFPLQLYSMAPWKQENVYYLVDTLSDAIFVAPDMNGDQLPEMLGYQYASAMQFPQLSGMLSVTPAVHPIHGFGIIVNHRDALYSRYIDPYEPCFFLMDTDGAPGADVCLDAFHYEFVTIKPRVVKPLPWPGDIHVTVFGTWNHPVQLWSTDETGQFMYEMLGAAPIIGGPYGEIMLMRHLIGGEYLLAVDAETGWRLRLPQQVTAPPVSGLTLLYDSHVEMLMMRWDELEGAGAYEIWESPGGHEFYPTGLVTPMTEAVLPLPPMEMMFYQVRAVR